jgi:hypothetical protein
LREAGKARERKGGLEMEKGMRAREKGRGKRYLKTIGTLCYFFVLLSDPPSLFLLC